jgi:hypothetical protein
VNEDWRNVTELRSKEIKQNGRFLTLVPVTLTYDDN